MIDFETKTMILHNQREDIKTFEVWFRTPFGLHTNLDQALKCLEGRDMEPQLTIVAVPVAISDSGKYEEMPR